MPLELTPSAWERWNGRTLWSRRRNVVGERHVLADMELVRHQHGGRDVWALHGSVWESIPGGGLAVRDDYVTLHPAVMRAIRDECEARDKGRARWTSGKGWRALRHGRTYPRDLGACHIVMLGTAEAPYATIQPIYQRAGETFPQWHDRVMLQDRKSTRLNSSHRT